MDAPRISQLIRYTTDMMNGSHSSKPLDGTIVDPFDQWAEKSPERVAAEWQGESLTYGSLHDASLHVSRALLFAGVRPRDRVPLLTQMSLEMLPSVIGILRVGACYVPMDVAAWSRARIEAALSQLASPVAVITSPCAGLQLPITTANFQTEWLVSMKESNYGEGEVFISGPGLAAGYLNNPTLTAQKFIEWNGQRFYRTADLARRTADGQLIWAGRADSLVKNRGFLINLETEVEPAMQAYPQVHLYVGSSIFIHLMRSTRIARIDPEENFPHCTNPAGIDHGTRLLVTLP